MSAHPPEILAVTYHYLAGTVFPGPGVHPFGPERFRAQVELLARSCRFLALEDLVSEPLFLFITQEGDSGCLGL